ncbi:MAG: M23 family metallopeptidase [Bacteroidota bacterium]
MPLEASHRKRPQSYSVLIVPSGEGAKTKSFTLRRWSLWLVVLGMFFGIATLTFVVLVYTPIGYYVQIPNPGMERRYGTELRQTQERLELLDEDLALLKDYNSQLRKALGESESKDANGTRKLPPSIMVTKPPQQMTVEVDTMVSTMNFEALDTATSADYDLEGGGYSGAGTGIENFRGSFPLLLPVEGFVTQAFNPERKHFGIDYAAKSGTAVHAATEGYVVFSGWTYDDGNMLILAHGGGYLTVYKHNQSLLVAGQTFAHRGDVIALVGETGKTSGGPHLHFEVWKDGVPLDPNEFLLTVHKIQ